MDTKLLELLTTAIGNYDEAKSLLQKLEDLILRFDTESTTLLRKYIDECTVVITEHKIPSDMFQAVNNTSSLFVLEKFTDSLLLSAATICSSCKIKFSDFMYKSARSMEYIVHQNLVQQTPILKNDITTDISKN